MDILFDRYYLLDSPRKFVRNSFGLRKNRLKNLESRLRQRTGEFKLSRLIKKFLIKRSKVSNQNAVREGRVQVPIGCSNRTSISRLQIQKTFKSKVWIKNKIVIIKIIDSVCDT